MATTKQNRRSKVTTESKTKRTKHPVGKPAAIKQRTNSKQQKILDLLRRPEGASIAAISKATGWQGHSVRGFFAGVVRKRLGLNLSATKVDDVRVYKITADQRGKSGSQRVEQSSQ